jgi:hypothetical protein
MIVACRKALVIASELPFQQPIAVLIPSQQREAIIKQTQMRLLRV